MALKDWKKASRIIIKDLENEGDNVLNVWSNKKTQENLFIIKSPRGYILGKKGLSQMCTPKLLKKPKTKAQALNFAKDYMETHPKIAKIKKQVGWKKTIENLVKKKRYTNTVINRIMVKTGEKNIFNYGVLIRSIGKEKKEFSVSLTKIQKKAPYYIFFESMVKNSKVDTKAKAKVIQMKVIRQLKSGSFDNIYCPCL